MWNGKGPMIGFLSADVWRWWVVWGRGGNRKTWMKCVKDDMEEFGLRKEDAQDRIYWSRGAPSPSSSAPWKPDRKALGTCNIITLFLNPVTGKTSDATPAPEGHSVLDIFLLFSFIFLMPKSNPT